MVIEANAVADPWTVVVHLEYAPIALPAVVRSIWLRPQAPPTESDSSVPLLLN